MTLLNVTNTTIKEPGALENTNDAIFTYTQLDADTFTNLATVASNILQTQSSSSSN